MNHDPTSLDRLHDLALPPDVPWWPWAPGWYVVFAALALAAAWLAWRSWKSWRANAYRRAALRELAALTEAPAIAELLRRTALAIVPRQVVAARTGVAWTDWLSAQCNEAMSPEVRLQLSASVYGRRAADSEAVALRAYAARWIAHHERVPLAALPNLQPPRSRDRKPAS